MIELDDRSRLRYDTLVLATGALPCPPSFEGAGLDGVLTLRTLSDADEILRRAELRPSCACIGGGTLGLEIAGALSRRGLKVTVIANHECLMHRQLSPGASAVLERHLARMGIGLEKAAKTGAILGGGAASGVALSDGRVVAAELVIVATGALPEIELAKRAGIKVNRGILVDDHMRTSDPSVFAAGDAAEFNGVLHGTWAPAKLQGEIAGLNAAGIDKSFKAAPHSTSLKIVGVNVFSMGRIPAENEDDRTVEQEEDGVFRSFLLNRGRMVGCILIGDTKCAGAARKAVENGTDFSDVLSRDASAKDICRILLG